VNWELDHVYVATEDAEGYERALQQVGLFTIEHGGDHEIELEWDEGRHGQLVRLAPEVPMVLRW